MNIEAIPRPEGKSTDYQFFRSAATGNRFKVKIVVTEAAAVQLGETPAANTQFGACITTAMIDETNKAVQENGLPVIDSWTHTFTPAETSAPGFSVQSRIGALLQSRISALEARYEARAILSQIRAEWSAEPINL